MKAFVKKIGCFLMACFMVFAIASCNNDGTLNPFPDNNGGTTPGEDTPDEGGDTSTPVEGTWQVVFDAQGGLPVPATQEVQNGKKATYPEEPTLEGYTFDGWYIGNEKWSFIGYVVTEDMTLTAKWLPITDIPDDSTGTEQPDNGSGESGDDTFDEDETTTSYTLIVQDTDGNPMVDYYITICKVENGEKTTCLPPQKTDANGKVVFEVAEGSYAVSDVNTGDDITLVQDYYLSGSDSETVVTVRRENVNEGGDTNTPDTPDEGGDAPPDGGIEDGDEVPTEYVYKIRTQSEGGFGLKDISITLYDGDTAVASVNTNANGDAFFTSEEVATLGTYRIEATNIPKGWSVKDNSVTYQTSTLSGSNVNINFSAALITDEEAPETKMYRLGDVMYDFSLKDSAGDTYKLSELLQSKKMVVLNFWATYCGPSASQFAVMQQAYELYQSSVEILAVSSYEPDTQTEVAKYKASKNLTFPMSGVPNSSVITSHFAVSGIPVTVVIDRYGVVSYRHEGSMVNLSNFTSLFDKFVGEDYVQTVIDPNAESGDEGNNGGNEGNDTDTPQWDRETEPLVIATSTPSGLFNPFYAAVQSDKDLVALTQIYMLALDSNGSLVCGEDQATVSLDYKITMYDTAEPGTGNVTDDPSKAKRTEYEFVIKNGIRFSDGNDLTIDDVLFNLYVYLDPMYTGETTISSVDIQGLTAYRTQTPGATNDGSISNIKENFYTQADLRIQYVMDKYGKYAGTYETGYEEQDQAVIDADFALAKTLFKEELESDWLTNFGTLESYQTEYNFTQDWEVYFLNAGLVNIEYEKQANGMYRALKDENGKYITTLDKIDDNDTDMGETYIMAMAEALEGKTIGSTEYIEAMKQKAIQMVYEHYVNEANAIISEEVLRYWATADLLREEIASQLLDEYYEAIGEDKISSISGITTYKTTNFENGIMGSLLNGEHNVLKIVIDNVDPKAIYDFAFAVAPMHYYGDGNDACGGAYDNYYQNANRVDNFGVPFGEKDFFDHVLQAPEKTGLPVGAGAYMAWSKNDSDDKTADTFWNNNVVYYKRNDYFQTVGSELENAKIKYLRYQVISSDQILNALATGTVHFGTPNASVDNIMQLNTLGDRLDYAHYETNGYGYVGINAKYVPDINIRRIIMKTMSLDDPKAYYGSLSNKIYRPISLTSWYYPTIDGDRFSERVFTAYGGVSSNGYAGDLTYYGDLNDADVSGVEDYDFMKNTINDTLDVLGYTKGSDGVRVNAKGYKLEYTFTIAGDSTDHPAYTMLQESANLLNACGFRITVRTDPQALIKLASGELQVWAAAWTSSIDPDMYQVYHKDSTATAVKGWGYDAIFQAGNETKYAEEIDIINGLSCLIEEGRETLDYSQRFATYTKALDLVMELAVELPIYQREDLYVYNKELIDEETLNQNPSPISGLLNRIWEVDFL